MAKPINKSYFPIRRQLPEHKDLTRKQLSKLKRVLAKHGRKLPKPGYCTITTKIGGKFANIVGSTENSTSEVCHYTRIVNGKVKHVYTMHGKAARNRRG